MYEVLEYELQRPDKLPCLLMHPNLLSSATYLSSIALCFFLPEQGVTSAQFV